MRLARHGAFVASAFVALGAAPPAAVSATAARDRCAGRPGAVVAANARLVVLRTRTGRLTFTYRACLRETGAALRLGERRRERDGSDGIAAIRVAGTWVAWEERERCARGSGCRTAEAGGVRIENLRDRRSRRSVHTPYDGGRLRAFAVNARGAAAWTRLVGDSFEVRKLDGDGEDALARGPDVAPSSLRLRGSRLTWRQRGRRRSYALDRDRPCGRLGSATYLRTPEVRVFLVRRTVRGILRGRVVGCLVAGERTTVLGNEPCDFFDGDACSVRRFRSAGPSVAFETGYCGRGACFADLRLVDLRAGRTAYRWTNYSGYREPAVGSTTDIEVTRRGSVAWIAGSEVRKREPGGEAVLLDAGPDVGPESLSPAGSTLSWLNGGRRVASRIE